MAVKTKKAAPTKADCDLLLVSGLDELSEIINGPLGLYSASEKIAAVKALADIRSKPPDPPMTKEEKLKAMIDDL